MGSSMDRRDFLKLGATAAAAGFAGRGALTGLPAAGARREGTASVAESVMPAVRRGGTLTMALPADPGTARLPDVNARRAYVTPSARRCSTYWCTSART